MKQIDLFQKLFKYFSVFEQKYITTSYHRVEDRQTYTIFWEINPKSIVQIIKNFNEFFSLKYAKGLFYSIWNSNKLQSFIIDRHNQG